MADCIHCGKPAGFLRKVHPECRNLYEAAEEKIPAMLVNFLQNPGAVAELKAAAIETARSHFVSTSELHRLAIAGISKMVDSAFDDHVISRDEEQKIDQLRDVFDITSQELSLTGVRFRLTRAAILRD